MILSYFINYDFYIFFFILFVIVLFKFIEKEAMLSELMKWNEYIWREIIIVAHYSKA